jgi:hypothetical protein
MEKINPQSGLTPIQEKAVLLLVAGKKYSQVSEELEIDRSTLYLWAEKLTFQTFFNKMCIEVQDEVRNGLFGMYNDAVKAVEEGLKSTNLTIKLKTATWLIEKLQNLNIGEKNPRNILREYATSSIWPEILDTTFDQKKYLKLCQENGIEP